MIIIRMINKSCADLVSRSSRPLVGLHRHVIDAHRHPGLHVVDWPQHAPMDFLLDGVTQDLVVPLGQHRHLRLELNHGGRQVREVLQPVLGPGVRHEAYLNKWK